MPSPSFLTFWTLGKDHWQLRHQKLPRTPFRGRCKKSQTDKYICKLHLIITNMSRLKRCSRRISKISHKFFTTLLRFCKPFKFHKRRWRTSWYLNPAIKIPRNVLKKLKQTRVFRKMRSVQLLQKLCCMIKVVNRHRLWVTAKNQLKVTFRKERSWKSSNLIRRTIAL